MVPYEVALTAVFVEGFVFVGLTMLGIRQWLARYVQSILEYPEVIC
jgi:AGZA family xanthine/uracil permease-like MFS transporter